MTPLGCCVVELSGAAPPIRLSSCIDQTGHARDNEVAMEMDEPAHLPAGTPRW